MEIDVPNRYDHVHVFQTKKGKGKVFITDEDMAKHLRTLSEDGEPDVSDEFLIEEAYMLNEIDQVAYTPYIRSWDLLIPVVEKIETLGYPVTIWIEGVSIESASSGKNITIQNLETCKETDKLTRCFKAVVEFIKWYNENK
ncbi:MAG: hypothetical protein ACXACY_19245 [Candidatus Hodarchaeales archaeon]